MRYVDAAIGEPIRSASPINRLATKIGGFAVGMIEGEWPICSECGRELDFYFQIDLMEPLRVSERYSFAYVFLCNGYIDEPNGQQCATFEPDSGSNAVVLLESPDPSRILSRGITRYDDFDIRFRFRRDPVVDSDDYDLPDEAFLDESGKESIQGDTSCTFKIGGTPVFVQEKRPVSCPQCGGVMTFLAQVGSELENPGWGGYSFPLGDAGEIFIYKCASECSPRGACLFWQC